MNSTESTPKPITPSVLTVITIYVYGEDSTVVNIEELEATLQNPQNGIEKGIVTIGEVNTKII